MNESDLHRSILAECKARGWIALHGDMRRKTHRTPGEPDFVILAEKEKTILIECKSENGTVTPAQLEMVYRAARLGHRIRIVRSVREFVAVIEAVVIEGSR